MENKTPRSISKVTVAVVEFHSQNPASTKGTFTSDEYLLIINFCSNSKVIPLSVRDPIVIDFENDLFSPKITFEMRDIKGANFGTTEVFLPTNLLETTENNLTEELTFVSNKKDKEPVKIKINLAFAIVPSPKKMFKSKPKATVEKKSSTQSFKSVLSGRASPGRKGDIRNNTQVENSNEKAFQDYLHNVVTKESARVKNIVDEHNSINECVHLNKVHKNLPFSFGENTLHIYSPQKLSYRGEEDSPVTPSQTVFLGRNSVPSLRTPNKKKSTSRENSNDKRLGNTANTGIFSSYSKEDSGPGSDRKGSSSQLLDTPQAVPVNLKKPKRENPGYSSARRQSPSPKQVRQQIPQQAGKESQVGEKVGSKERKYQSQVEYLSQVIVNIEARLKKNEVIKQENVKLKQDADSVLEDRKVLQEALNEAISQFKEVVTDLQKQSFQFLDQKENLIVSQNELLNKVQELEQNLAQAKLNLNQKENQATALNAKVEDLTNSNQQLEGAQKAFEGSEQKRAEEQKAYAQNIERFEKSTEELQAIIQELTKEKKELRRELQQSRQELGDVKDTNTQLSIDLLMLEKKLAHAEGYKEIIKSLENQRNELEQRLSENKGANIQVERTIDKACKEFAAKVEAAGVKEKQQADEINVLKAKLISYETRNSQLQQEINEIELKNKEISATKYSMQKSEFLMENMRKERDELKEKLSQANEDKKTLGQQIETLALNHKETNDKVLELESTITQLQSSLKQSDSQIQSFCQLAEEIEDENVVYVPLKNDPIDGALADYINTTQGSRGLKLLFMRECEGVYQFGSKKIYIKIEGDKILIRVGGGYLTIDEFIKQNAEQEFERLTKKDPLKLLSRNIAINKMIVGKCVNCFEKSKIQTYECP